MSEIPGSALAEWIRQNPKKGAVSGNAYTGVVDKDVFGDGSQGTGVRGKFWKDGVLQDGTEPAKPLPTLWDIINDPMFVPAGLSIAGGICAIGLSLNPDVLKIAVQTAGKVVEGFTPGRITDIGGG